jgi:hypothetical protein
MKPIAFLLLAFFLVAIPPALSQDANYWLIQTHSDYNNGSYSLALQDIDEYLDLNSSEPQIALTSSSSWTAPMLKPTTTEP